MKGMAIILAAFVAFGVTLQASTHHSKSDILVVPPSALPEMAQQASQDLLLHYSGSGTPYLYLEQQGGARLAIFDVSEPARIRQVGSIETGLKKAFDFVQPLNSAMELIRFRDGSGTAILDLRKAKAPRIGDTVQLMAVPIAMVGATGCLATSMPAGLAPLDLRAQNLQVLDNADGLKPVATVDGVTRRAELSGMGTVFLLGSRGLTVVRSLSAEQQCAMESMVNSHN